MLKGKKCIKISGGEDVQGSLALYDSFVTIYLSLFIFIVIYLSL